MMRTRLIVLAAVATVGLAACSSSSTGGAYGGGGVTSTPAAGGAAATVATANVGSVGSVLVDGTGRTLYLFESDTGTTSTCTGSCAGTWPALITGGAATTGSGATASMLGTTTRDDGTTQVTYNGHPLYVYSGDSAAGQANGEGIGGVWFAVTASGTPAQPATGGSPTASSSGGGGYGHG